MNLPDVLNDPVAQELLNSRELARFGYTWTDGSPRVVPVWFHWTGSEIVVASPDKAPKLRALSTGAKVALTIDTSNWPHHVLMVRGTAKVEPVDGVVPEYAAAAERYFGPDQGRAWVDQLRQAGAKMKRIGITPTAARLMDFETRFPSAIAALLGTGSGPAQA